MIIVRCSSTERVTFDDVCDDEDVWWWERALDDLYVAVAGDGYAASPPVSESEAAAAVRNRWRDSLKLGPDSIADSSPDRSEEKKEVA